MIQDRHSHQRRPCYKAARAFKGLDTQAAPWSVPFLLKDSSSSSHHWRQVSSQDFQRPVERFGLAGRKIEFFSACVMWTSVRKEVGQTLGVVILTGCVPLIIRKLLSTAAFCRLNCEGEKAPSSLQQMDGTKYTTWDEGPSVWLNVKDKGRGWLAPEGQKWVTGSRPLKFQKFLSFPTDGNYSYKYKKDCCY